jgi:hypothetical protein
MKELRQADVADPHALRFETYDVQKWKPIERREYTFRARPDAPVEALARFLTARVHRPVVGHYPEGSHFQAAAFHRRALRGPLEFWRPAKSRFGSLAANARIHEPGSIVTSRRSADLIHFVSA